MSNSDASAFVLIAFLVCLWIAAGIAWLMRAARSGVLTDDTVPVAIGVALFLPVATFIITYAALR